MTARNLVAATSLLTISISFSACGEEPSDATEGEQGVVRQHTFGWVRIGDCATSIGVSPDDTLWLVGCDNRADGDIWYTRLEGDAFAQSRAWIQTSGRGKWVNVDDAGSPYVTTSSGDRYYAAVNTTNGKTPATPSGNWTIWFRSSDGVQDVLFNHSESYLLFQTANELGNVSLSQHRFYRIATPTDGTTNGSVGTRSQATQIWTDTGIKAQSLALFTPNGGPSANKELWTLSSNGGIKSYDPTLNNGGVPRPSPPSKALSLTDHYALTSGGVYHWNDSALDWEFYLDRATPTGQVIQVAHAGAVTVKLPSGKSATFESGVWAVDNSGVIYKAGDQTAIF